MKNLFCAGENTEAKRSIEVVEWGGIRKDTHNPIIEGERPVYAIIVNVFCARGDKCE